MVWKAGQSGNPKGRPRTIDPLKAKLKHYEYSTARFRSIRAKLNFLKTAPCTDCGNAFDPECMDWDHLPGFNKKFKIGDAWRGRLDVMLSELVKCELVCANCHRLRSKKRREDELPQVKKLDDSLPVICRWLAAGVSSFLELALGVPSK